MTALRVVEPGVQPSYPAALWLYSVLDRLGDEVRDALAGCDDAVGEAERIDRITLLERLRGAVAARQAAECVQLGRARVERELAQDRHPRDIGRGLTEEVALACRLSPSLAARRMSSARAWWFDLPETFALLAAGQVSEEVGETVVRETRHLGAQARRAVDARVSPRLATSGRQEAAAFARRCAYEADPHGYVERGRTERRHRRVGLRPAPDTMAVLTGYLPVEQGVACLAALRRHTDGIVATGDERTRDQIMADTLVERLTGQERASDVNVEVGILVPLDALSDPDSSRATTLNGAGPLPAGLAQEVLGLSRGRITWRRLFLSATGQVVGAGRRRRHFGSALTRLIAARDQVCRDPFCGAPVRHIDHVERFADGGPTTLTNGRGTCARHNLVRELPGWSVRLEHDGLGDEPHTVRVRTPTGHSYLSRAPDPP